MVVAEGGGVRLGSDDPEPVGGQRPGESAAAVPSRSRLLFDEPCQRRLRASVYLEQTPHGVLPAVVPTSPPVP